MGAVQSNGNLTSDGLRRFSYDAANGNTTDQWHPCACEAYQYVITFTMSSQGPKETGLDYLLGLNGNIEVQNDDGYWVKMEVCRVAVTTERPYGIKYSLTLHAPDSTRLIGFDNAHGGVKPEGSRFLHAGKKYPYDHRHRHADDAGVLYQFNTAYQLVSDFYAEVDRVLKEVSQ